jgi:tetratricopeptide (TPR) repeat protein
MIKKTFLVFGLLFLMSNAFAFDDSTVEFARAEKQFEARQYVQAEASYRQALEKYKNMGDLAAYIKNRIGDCCQYEGKTEDAVQMYRNLQSENSASPLAVQEQEKIARAYYQAKKYDKAALEFEKLSEQVETQQKSQVSASAVNNSIKYYANMKEEALGYSAFCYNKIGERNKAVAATMKMKAFNGSAAKK